MLSSALILQAIAALAFYIKTIFYNAVYHVLHSKDDERNVQQALWELESDDAGWYRPPGLGDDRAPCPALNSMANHGYLYVLH
jgi:hypothetical protein